MKCLILAAGYATRLYPLTENFPKPLLKVGDKAILDWLIDDLAKAPEIDEFVVVSNHKFSRQFEEWAGGKDVKITVVDDGTSTNETRLGAVRDIEFAIEKLGINSDLLVMAGDNMLDFSLREFVNYARSCGTSAVMCHEENDLKKQRKTAIITMDEGGLITSYEEKPEEPKGHYAVPPFYYYRAEDVKRIPEALAAGCGADAPGSYASWLSYQTPMHAFVMPGRRYDIGDIRSYEEVQRIFSTASAGEADAGKEGLVSIVVPVYGAAAYIEKTIRCVEQQTYSDWELILVDDCGPDDSLAVIENYRAGSPHRDQIRVVRNEVNSGAAKTRNHGVREANGRYIAFLDADDLWMPEKLAKQLSFLKKQNAGFTFTAYEFGDEEARGTGKFVRVPEKLDFHHALSRTVIFTSTVMFDTKKIDRSRIRMPEIASEDTALWWTLLKEGETAYGLGEVLTVYRRPQKSLSSNKGEAVKRLWNLLIRIAGCSRPKACFYLIGWAVRATLRRL